MAWTIEQKVFGVSIKSSGSRLVNYCETNGSIIAHPSKELLINEFNRLFPPTDKAFREETVEKHIRKLSLTEGEFYFINPAFFQKSIWYKQSHVEKKVYGVLARNPESILFDPVKQTVEKNQKIVEKPVKQKR